MDSNGHFVPACQPHSVSHGLGLPGPIIGLVGITGKEVGQLIRDAREARGMTRADLGEKVGLDEESIKKIETGERVKQWLHVANFAAALGISPNEILGYPIASVTALTEALRPILSAFGANPEDAESIARILLEAVSDVQSLPGDEPAELRYRIAGQLAAARFRRR